MFKCPISRRSNVGFSANKFYETGTLASEGQVLGVRTPSVLFRTIISDTNFTRFPIFQKFVGSLNDVETSRRFNRSFPIHGITFPNKNFHFFMPLK